MITVPLAAYEDDEGNRIEYDGPPRENITIAFRGGGNLVRVHAKASATKLHVDFNSSNGTFILGANPHQRAFSAGVRVGEDATVRIGNGVSATAAVTISAVEGVSVIIGNDVMFATANQVRADDGHPIFDVRSGKRVNKARSIRIGDHVWLAYGAMVLAGATIGEGSVIGAGSIVTRRIPNNVIAVGSPATVVRKDIAWERPHLGLVAPFYKPDASTVQKSKYWNRTVENGTAIRRTFLGRVARRLRRMVRAVRSPRASR
ncbi:hypothetical protein GCM10022240_20940 [Microbacterium kribbense]|uniref:Acyltransferase n=1 Tax=Microbacterium kribbense TaxID=433645 RepID=A0ABP7GLC5_9MICO